MSNIIIACAFRFETLQARCNYCGSFSHHVATDNKLKKNVDN